MKAFLSKYPLFIPSLLVSFATLALMGAPFIAYIPTFFFVAIIIYFIEKDVDRG